MPHDRTLDDWLDPHRTPCTRKSIDMGLDRVREVAQRLGTEASGEEGHHRRRHQRQGLDRRLHRSDRARRGLAGRRLHLAAPAALQRARAHRRRATPTTRMLVAAFEAIEAARGDMPLTYFEYGTLARAVAVRARRARPGDPRSRPRRPPGRGQHRRCRRRGDHHRRPRPPGLARQRPRGDRRREGRHRARLEAAGAGRRRSAVERAAAMPTRSARSGDPRELRFLLRAPATHGRLALARVGLSDRPADAGAGRAGAAAQRRRRDRGPARAAAQADAEAQRSPKASREAHVRGPPAALRARRGRDPGRRRPQPAGRARAGRMAGGDPPHRNARSPCSPRWRQGRGGRGRRRWRRASTAGILAGLDEAGPRGGSVAGFRRSAWLARPQRTAPACTVSPQRWPRRCRRRSAGDRILVFGSFHTVAAALDWLARD